MSQLKSNPHVYPFVPFLDLSNKNFSANFEGKKLLDNDQIKHYLQLINVPTFTKDAKLEDDIINYFINPEVGFGPTEYITDLREYWTSKLTKFISNNKRIEFTILGFPFKMPIPLKTKRTLPDLGELLSLYKLNLITKEFAKVYKPGAKITIFCEGVFGRFNELSDEEIKSYVEYLKKLVIEFELSNIEIRELSEMESLDDNFSQIFDNEVLSMKNRYKDGDKEVEDKVKGTLESVKRIINTKIYNLSTPELMDLYNEDIPVDDLPNNLKKLRITLEQKTMDMIFNYLSYLKTRDHLDFIENTIPGAITLTVSPKKYRIGIHPINSEFVRLPYHGVPVYDEKNHSLSIEYLVDIQREKAEFIEAVREKDQDPEPFIYIRK